MIKYFTIIFLFALPIYLIKKKFVKIENTLIWLIILFFLSILSLNIEFLKKISYFFGIISPVNFLIFSSFLVFLFLFLNLLKKVSDLENKIEDIVIRSNLEDSKGDSKKAE